ncbi:MAG: DUF2452 domain-containing protein [Chitinophagaceae bacterium]
MNSAYNFIGSWQLFPERGTYEWGNRPKSGLYQLETQTENKELTITQSWITLENEGFNFQYKIDAGGEQRPLVDPALGDSIRLTLMDNLNLEVSVFQGDKTTLKVKHSLLPSGYLQLEQQGFTPSGDEYQNIEVYHRQMSVLPFAASASDVVIKPTNEGMMRHKALMAMEEQTNMHLAQIREQVELLARQAQEIHQRKELAYLIYGAKLSFKPEIGQVYFLYQKRDDSHVLSMISPEEWGASMPFDSFVAAVQKLADHTWKSIP